MSGAGHHHHHAGGSHDRAFAVGIALNTLFVVIEAGAGWWSGSLGLLADAGHNLTDVLALLLAWAAAWLSARQPTAHRTYGFSRASILAALASAVLLLAAVGAMAWEAWQRLSQPTPVDGWTMVLVAGIGVLVNAGTAALFHAGGQHDLNLRGVYLHMAADAAVSLGVVLAGIAILFGGWLWLDPLAGLLVAVVICISGWALLRESLDLLLDAVPRGIDPRSVERYLADLPGVSGVHDLHIWAMSTSRTALTAHLVMPASDAGDRFLETLRAGLQQHFGIGHVTVQIERDDGGLRCAQVDDGTL